MWMSFETRQLIFIEAPVLRPRGMGCCKNSHLTQLGEHCLLGQSRRRGLRDAEINYLRDSMLVVFGDQYVSGLDIAMNKSLLMGMLHGLANLQQQFQPFAERQMFFIAILRD